VQYLYYEQANKSRALNYALTQITSDLVIFFDDDVRLHADTLVAYERAAGEHPRCYFGGPLEIDYERPPPDWLIPYLPHSARGWHFESQSGDERPVFLGANQAAFRSALQEAGGFDPTVGPGRGQGVGEDTRIQISMSAVGYQAHYVPDAVVWHYVPVTACSPTWALERAYRQALTFGESLQDESPRLLGVPRWMLREWLSKRLRLGKLALLRASDENRFAARVDERRLRGWIDGFRRRAK
jgi:cellulose synthase/poly-beta-1,6-N-acetylglucosamine synthase-like glycosyltransferase